MCRMMLDYLCPLGRWGSKVLMSATKRDHPDAPSHRGLGSLAPEDQHFNPTCFNWQGFDMFESDLYL